MKKESPSSVATPRQITKDLQDSLLSYTSSPFNSNQLTISNLEVSCHKGIKDILKATSKLTKELNIQLEEAYAAHTTMTSFLYPTSGKYKVVIVNILYDLLYYIDDLFGEDIEGADQYDKPSLTELMYIWQTGEINAAYYDKLTNEKVQTVCTAMQWVRNKLFQSCEPAFFQKLSWLLSEHLRDQLEPDNYGSIEEYILLRRNFSGMYVAIYLIEYCTGNCLTDEMLKKVPNLQKAIDLCTDIGGLSNDIFSYPKERHSKFNLVNSFGELNETNSLNEAIQKSIDLVNDCHTDFNRSVQQIQLEVTALEEEEKAIVLEFTDGLKSILSATYHWQLVTKRYRHKNHILEDLKYKSDRMN